MSDADGAADGDGDLSNIRKVLGFLVGRTVVDVLQHDPDEWAEEGAFFVELLFDDGSVVRFPVGDNPISVTKATDDADDAETEP